MTADKLLFPIHTTKHKEVTMVKRIAVSAIVLAAFLILAVPAFAFNGYRGDYTTSAACAVCHQSGQPANAPKVYNDWAATKHGTDAEGGNAALSIPTGSTCGGCHTSNYDPTKVVPTAPVTTVATASPFATTVAWSADLPTVTITPGGTASPYPSPVLTAPQALGNYPMSELDVGCSSCHYGANVNGTIANAGNDPGDTAHTAAPVALADSDICGACHSRYAYTVNTFPVTAPPYNKIAGGLPTNSPAPVNTIQPQMALDYPVLHGKALSSFLNIPVSGWTPTPSATKASGLQIYWSYNGSPTVWQSVGHDGSAAQYPEWKAEKHASALVDLKAAVGPNPPASCLQCHSADYRNAPSGAKPTGAQAQYGITCVGCHTPHNAGQAKGVWDSGFDTQLVGDPANPSDLCSTCHNDQNGDAVVAAGSSVYENQKEVMNGTGAIGVPNGLLVSNHNNKCVQCHMPPTSYGRGAPQLGGNHTFKVIYPVVAANATSTGAAGLAMPYSACSTCHNKPSDPLATGMQPIADAHQATMHSWYSKVQSDLVAAGQRMGFAHTSSATDYITWLNDQLNTKGSTKWTPDELKWQQAFTDWTYTAAEGSWGIHNYSYSLLVIQTADTLANQAGKTPQSLTLKLSKTSVKKNTKVTFSGTVSPATAGTVQIQKKSHGVFKNWKSAKLSNGKYSIKVKMTSKGTFYYKAYLAPNPSYAGNTTKQVTLKVKK